MRIKNLQTLTLRGESEELYTLVGNLDGFSNGDKVVACGIIADINFCMQSATMNVTWIGSEVPRAR